MRVLCAVEMWCRRQAAALVLPLLLAGWLTGESSEALTTFGKTNTQPPYQPPQPTLPPARECRTQADCAGIRRTSCVRTGWDSTTRCLCGDDQPPVNGRCETKLQGLRHVCSDGAECAEGLVCAAPNVTSSSGGLARPAWAAPTHAERQTLCLCDTESGYVEREHACSDAEILKTTLLTILAFSAIKIFAL